MKNLTAVLLLIMFCAGCFHEKDENDVHLKVFKSDESLQCQPNSGITLEDMAQELIDAGVDVICSQKGSDGMARPAVCDIESGGINVYTINAVNLDDVNSLGYESVEILPDYIDEACGN